MSYQNYPYQQQQQQGGGYYPPPPQHDPFRAYYADRLRQLTFNSRPIIQDLSMMAGQQRDQNNWEGMNTVVQEIEEATLRALPTQKLPLLYLIDSISKNIGPPYTTHLLPPIIPRLYLRTYREVDGVTKSKMEEMINLWRTGGPNRSELYGPGVREQIERDIFGSSYNGIPPRGAAAGGLPPPGEVIGGGGGFPSLQQVKNTVQGALDKKQREAASKAWDMATGQQVNALTGILNLLNSTNVSPQELVQIMEQVKSLGLAPGTSIPKAQPTQQSIIPSQPQPRIQPGYNGIPQTQPPSTPNWGNQPQPIIPPNPSLPPQPYLNARPPFAPNLPTPPQANLATPIPGSTTPIPISNPVVAPAIQIPAIANLPIDVSKILSSLNKSGVVSQSRTPEPQVTPSTPQLPQKSNLESYEDIIINMNITLQNIDLNVPNKLSFEHLPHRCKQCGMRFASDDQKFQAHMDWHFRRNRKERESAGRGAHRRWLPRAEEWINDTYSSNEAGPSTSTLPGSPGKTGGATTISAERMLQLKQKWAKVPQDTRKATSVCPVCKESFVKEWSEDEEEWIWKNALNINGTFYHATCRAEQLSAMRRLKGSDPNKRSTSGSPRLTPQPSDQTQPLSHQTQVKTEPSDNNTLSVPQPTIQVKSEPADQTSTPISASPKSQSKRKAEEEENVQRSGDGSESKRVKVEPNSGDAIDNVMGQVDQVMLDAPNHNENDERSSKIPDPIDQATNEEINSTQPENQIPVVPNENAQILSDNAIKIDEGSHGTGDTDRVFGIVNKEESQNEPFQTGENGTAVTKDIIGSSEAQESTKDQLIDTDISLQPSSDALGEAAQDVLEVQPSTTVITEQPVAVTSDEAV
ncbi:uncharacterized protein L201_004237 [Kwoniella dendrophila CBS 6074]|uniref:CID domain-containing protein n=1 Tax=Kwoniella dendrophila CBS 6074 TaxID=1295534 RepID=A0AAX4JVM6_9TREE